MAPLLTEGLPGMRRLMEALRTRRPECIRAPSVGSRGAGSLGATHSEDNPALAAFTAEDSAEGASMEAAEDSAVGATAAGATAAVATDNSLEAIHYETSNDEYD